MASATGSHPDTGSLVRPLPGSSTTIRPAASRRFGAPKMPLLTERGFDLSHPGPELTRAVSAARRIIGRPAPGGASARPGHHPAFSVGLFDDGGSQ